MLPVWACVQRPPVLPVMVVSAIFRSPVKSLLVKNTPPPNAFVPAALFRIASPHRTMSTPVPSL
jgi:hypothetical protein